MLFYSVHSALELNIFNHFGLKSHLRWQNTMWRPKGTYGRMKCVQPSQFFQFFSYFEAPWRLCALAHTVHPWSDQFTFVDSLNKSILNCLYLWGHFQIFGPYSTHFMPSVSYFPSYLKGHILSLKYNESNSSLSAFRYNNQKVVVRKRKKKKKKITLCNYFPKS